MAITESQLETWSHVGSKSQSAATYQVIRSVLKNPDAPYASPHVEVFLQGSYGNDTNVRGSESDVDVVICLKNVFNSDICNLDPVDKQAYEANRSPASYGYKDFKAEVLAWLRKNFGNGVMPGRKAIAVPGGASRRDADVLACIEHRRYTSYLTPSDNQHHAGIYFVSSDGVGIRNFPKQHKQNCTSKHQDTSSRFKSHVRVLKNLRNAMVNDGYLKKGIAPSYFLEGMLWNVPNQKFVAGYQQSFENYLHWLECCNANELCCANRLHWLIRENSHVCWNMQSFQTFLAAARQYWNSSGR